MTAQQLGMVLYSMACIFLAAVVRGYSGFGFSMLSITALSLFFEPREIVPPIFLLELVASVNLLLRSWQDVHWTSIRWLLLGCLVATPFGVYALARLPAEPLTLGLALTILGLVGLLSAGFVMQRMPGRLATFGVGMCSGLLNGSLGVGGPPVILFYFGSPASVAAGRASMIAYFLFTDLLALGWQWVDGVLERAVFWRALLFVLPLLAGLKLGARWFARVDPAEFRRWVLRLLVVLALATGARAAWRLL